MVRKPKLLDSLLRESENTQCQINGRWYISKPVQLFDIPTLIEHLYHAWLVICGRATTIQYAEDKFKLAKKKYS
jgi:hypothetical protein